MPRLWSNSCKSTSHMLTCPNPEVDQYRAMQLDILEKKLSKLGTIKWVLTHIMHGIHAWEVYQSTNSPIRTPPTQSHNAEASDHSTHSPTQDPAEKLTLQAFYHQTDILGWEALLWGGSPAYGAKPTNKQVCKHTRLWTPLHGHPNLYKLPCSTASPCGNTPATWTMEVQRYSNKSLNWKSYIMQFPAHTKHLPRTNLSYPGT